MVKETMEKINHYFKRYIIKNKTKFFQKYKKLTNYSHCRRTKYKKVKFITYDLSIKFMINDKNYGNKMVGSG